MRAPSTDWRSANFTGLISLAMVMLAAITRPGLAGDQLVMGMLSDAHTTAASAEHVQLPEHSTVPELSVIKVQTRSANSRSDIINPPLTSGPTNEFHLARLVFDVNAQHGWGPGRPWWRIDWPEAEFHFLNGVDRYTVIDHSEDSVHITLDDDALFDYPWLFVQQAGRWHIDDQDAKILGEYLLRGGFLLADDIHGPNDWNTLTQALSRALPNYSIEEIRANDSVINILYDIDNSVQIPGRRHIMSNDGNSKPEIRMPFSPHQWRGIKDSDGRWIVAINFNMDMGDSWEHANDPYYPLDMTSLGYQLGMNYVVYAMTH